MTCGPGGCTTSTTISVLSFWITIAGLMAWLFARSCAWWWHPTIEAMQAQMLREIRERYRFVWRRGLPKGLAMTQSGTLFGTPNVVSDFPYRFTITVSGGSGP